MHTGSFVKEDFSSLFDVTVSHMKANISKPHSPNSGEADSLLGAVKTALSLVEHPNVLGYLLLSINCHHDLEMRYRN